MKEDVVKIVLSSGLKSGHLPLSAVPSSTLESSIHFPSLLGTPLYFVKS